MGGSCLCGLWNSKEKSDSQQPEGVKTEETAIPIPETDDDGRVKDVPKYTYVQLAEACGDFSNNNRLGEGGAAHVYKGILPNGNKVAIKRLKHHSDPKIEEMAQLQFGEEVKTISRIRHPNIVELVGYCSDQSDRLLVYELVSKNSLRSHLHDEMESRTIDWPSRMRIALGTAKALAYLHEDCKPRIIHRDIKSDNILLDDKLNPKIGDFGISKDFAESATHVSTDPRGTPAYAPPEYYRKDGQNRKLTDKSDVFSFGVVLLELITGKFAVFKKQRNEYIRLATWAIDSIKRILDTDNQDLVTEHYDGFLDPKLGKEYNLDEINKMIYCAASCVYKPSHSRPQMIQIVEVLKGDMEAKDIWARNDSKYLYEGSPYAALAE